MTEKTYTEAEIDAAIVEAMLIRAQKFLPFRDNQDEFLTEFIPIFRRRVKDCLEGRRARLIDDKSVYYGLTRVGL
jgi:hypothetical protein